MVVLLVLEFDLMKVVVVIVRVVWENEIENCHDIHVVETVISGLSLLGLLNDGGRGIIHGVVLEVRMVGPLHLDDEIASVLSDIYLN